MRFIYLLIILSCFSCNNERVLQLPEIENAEVTEVLDVSPGYIFYDETQPDSTLLNRKNLIITTNWLVNVDKRLTLRQAIPHIKFLQDKKRNAEMHKNEEAKNYFTCNDTSIGNLGFVEFTDVEFITTNEIIDLQTEIKIIDTSYKRNELDSTKLVNSLSGIYYRNIDLKFGFKNNNYIIYDDYKISNAEVAKPLFFDYLNYRIETELLANAFKIKLHFSSSISFQEYIWIKSNLLKLNSKMVIIEHEEFIY